MGAFPADDLTYANLDGTTDDPSQARAELLAAIQKIQAIIASFNDNSGLCPLDSSGFLPDAKVNATAMTALLNVATTSLKGLMSAADKTKLNGIATNANNYTLPTATASTLGGIKVGDGLSISSGVLSADAQTQYVSAHAAGSYSMLPGNSSLGMEVITYNNHATETERIEWKIARSGTIRVRIGCKVSSGMLVTTKIRVLKNDVSVYQHTNSTSTWSYYNVDIAVDASDTIQIKTYAWNANNDAVGDFWAVPMSNNPADVGVLYTYID